MHFRRINPFILIVTAILTAWISLPVLADSFEEQLVAAAIERTGHSVRYDGSYFSIPYPMGDVPEDIGVCTDVLIRSYRQVGFDLQQAVHEDMSANFDDYPSNWIWGLTRPDPNIDHRRVPNLRTYFKRHGESLPVNDEPNAFLPGDIVTWVLPGNLPHIGIVTDRHSHADNTPMIVHNIGAGPKLEDMLFDYPITGHYRFLPNTD